MIRSAKNYTKKKKKWTDRTLGQMVKDIKEKIIGCNSSDTCQRHSHY